MARTILHYGNEYLGTPAQVGVIPEGVIIADPDTNTIKMGNGVAVGGVNVTLQASVAWTDITGKPANLDAISGDSTDFTYNATTNTLTVNGTVDTTTITANTYNFNGATVNNLDYSSISNTPTLFSGAFTDLTGKPTTLSGYGITDALGSNINNLQINGAILNDLLKPGYLNGLALGGSSDASPSPANDNGLAQNTEFAIATPYIYTKYIESDAKTVNFSGIAFGSNNPYISLLDESSEGKIAFVADGVVPLIATPQGIIPGDANMNIGTSSKPYKTMYADSFIGNVDFNNVSNTPTTLAGYGITDAVSTDGPTLTINSAETGTGVAGNISGIKIERGILQNVEMVYDESIIWIDPNTQTTSQGPDLQGPGYGSFRLSSSSGDTLALRVANINNSNSIYFEPGGLGTLRLGGSIAPAGYVSRMTDDNDIPNKKYVDDALTNKISTVVEDTTPQLGGDLDLNSNNIVGTGNINVTGSVTISGTVSASNVLAVDDLKGSVFGDDSTLLVDAVNSTIPQSVIGQTGREITHTAVTSTSTSAVGQAPAVPIKNDSVFERIIVTNNSGANNRITIPATTVPGKMVSIEGLNSNQDPITIDVWTRQGYATNDTITTINVLVLVWTGADWVNIG